MINHLDDPIVTLQGAYIPEDGHSSAPSMTLRTGLRTSSNRAAVRLLQDVGIAKTVQYAKSMGIGDVPNVPSLDESTVSANLPMRERLAAHRSNAVCANCHRTIDPVGFSLESFNAIGQWRDHEADDVPIDVSGALPGSGE